MNEERQLRIPDGELDFDADLNYYHKGARFTGVAFDDTPGFLDSEISYRDGFQAGVVRDWYRSGQLRVQEEFWRNFEHLEERRRMFDLG